MKLVKENINERFSEKTDPIKDMHIGIKWEVEQLLEKIQEIWDEYYLKLVNDEKIGEELEVIERIQEMINEMSIMKNENN